MRYAAEVIIVPVYGLSAARRARKAVRICKAATAPPGVVVKVRDPIPVAGRMPGQMGMFCSAEAGVPYDLIFQA